MNRFSEIIVRKRRIIYIVYLIAAIACAVGIFTTNINYDMSKYLPDDSQVKKGMSVMEDEFGKSSAITVMFDGLSETEQLQRQQELSEIDNVKSVVFIQNDEAYQKDGHSKYTVTIASDTYSKTSREVLSDIRDIYGDEAYISGAVVDNDLMVKSLLNDIPVISVIATVIIFTILFILCDSWTEPFLFMLCIGAAILVNMGTNALLPSVSFMTFAVGAVLQMGLSMDYSIMLMNRYSQEKKVHANHEEAMISALANSFAPISGSSVTTIVGLLALVFMDFKIGQDMGVVLAKGVFFSLVSIFTLLPGLVVSFDKLIEKSRKPSITIKTGKLMGGISKLRGIIIPLALIAVGFSFIYKDDVKVGFLKMFDNSDQTYTEECFGYDNQTVLMYRNTTSQEKISEYITWLGTRDDVNSVQDYSNTLGRPCTAGEIAAQFGFPAEQAQMMYQAMGVETMTMEEFIGASIQGGSEDPALLQAQQMINENRSQMVGSEYNRMVISLNHESEGEATFDAVGELLDKADEVLGENYYLVGDTVMGYEMNDGFKSEMNFVTLLTTIAIFVVVIFTFRSIFSSAILVAVIQAAVYITTAAMAIMGFTVNYIALILVQCILMGATIDYGILFVCNYVEERGKLEKKEALASAMDKSIKTILTSSLVLIGCCMTTGILMTQKVISQTCSMVAFGAATAAFMVVFVLPVIIFALDKLVLIRFGKSNAEAPAEVKFNERKKQSARKAD